MYFFFVYSATQGDTGLFRDVLMERHPKPSSISIDAMHIADRTTLNVTVDGSMKPFDATGHYPVLAGHTQTSMGNNDSVPLYVAQAVLERGREGDILRSNYYATLVKDGASGVTFVDRAGKTNETNIFGVLVLRYDPSDRESIALALDDERTKKMDPTGPLLWREVTLENPEDKAHFDYVFGRGSSDLYFRRWAFPGISYERSNNRNGTDEG